ncbi:hypothetical protein AAG906_010418 [Vitis piasezkii]
MPRARNKLIARPRRSTRSSPLSHGNGTERRTAIYPTVGSEYQNVVVVTTLLASDFFYLGHQQPHWLFLDDTTM